MTSTRTSGQRVAIVHDDLTQRGGAERVVLSLHRLFRDAPIFTTVYDPEGTYPEFRDVDVRTTFLQRLPHRGGAARTLLPLYPAAVSRIDLSDFDLVISSSSRFAHGVKTPGAVHITYCHNPARFLYQGDEYFGQGGPVPPWSRRVLTPLLAALRRWDRRAAQRPDLYVANSQVTADRIARHYGRKARVIHPPVDLSRFAAVDPAAHRRVPSEPYYLVLSRLLAYKRVDLAAAACRRAGKRLVVVGSGPASDTIREAGGSHVEIRSGVDETELAALLTHCTALIQPGLEDFGLSPIEANAAGRPAIAFGAGGALETVVDGTTGLLFADQTVPALVDALRRAESVEWNEATLRDHAVAMGEGRFHEELVALVATARGEARETPSEARETPRICAT